MYIESIDQELIDGTTERMTRVVINQVNSPCILTRLMIDVAGKPGVDNDMEFLGSGDQWMIVWTYPQLTIDEARELVTRAIEPPTQA